MKRILIRWLWSAIPVLVIVTLLTFVLTSLVPGDAGRAILGQSATPQAVAALDRQLGQDEPLPLRYWNWLVGVLHGDLGASIISGQPVAQEIAQRLPITLWLILGAVILGAVLGIALGVLSALRGGWLGKAVDVLSVIGMAVPGFWLGLVLVLLFAVEVRIFPATGYIPLTTNPVAWFSSLVLPVITLGVPAAAPIAKQTRDGMLGSLGQDWVRALRARGISERSIVLRHVLRNAAPPIVTVIGIIAVVLLGGTVLVETVFVMPGLGGLAVYATNTHDIPTMQGLALVFAVIVMVVNLGLEFVYAALNPKVRT